MKRKRAKDKARAAAAAGTPSPVPADAPVAASPPELEQLRDEIRGRDTDLVDALQRVAASYDRMAEQLEHDRRVQALLAEALVRIDRRLAGIEAGRPPTGREIGRAKREELPRGPRVIGGSIAPRQDVPRVDH